MTQKIKSRYPNADKKTVLTKIKPVLKKVLENDESSKLTEEQKKEVDNLMYNIGFSEAEWQTIVPSYQDPIPCNAELIQETYYKVLPEIQRALDLSFQKGDQICLADLTGRTACDYLTLTIDEVKKDDDSSQEYFSSFEMGNQVKFRIDDDKRLHFFGWLRKEIDQTSYEFLFQNAPKQIKIVPTDLAGNTPVLKQTLEPLTLDNGVVLQLTNTPALDLKEAKMREKMVDTAQYKKALFQVNRLTDYKLTTGFLISPSQDSMSRTNIPVGVFYASNQGETEEL